MGVLSRGLGPADVKYSVIESLVQALQGSRSAAKRPAHAKTSSAPRLRKANPLHFAVQVEAACHTKVYSTILASLALQCHAPKGGPGPLLQARVAQDSVTMRTTR